MSSSGLLYSDDDECLNEGGVQKDKKRNIVKGDQKGTTAWTVTCES